MPQLIGESLEISLDFPPVTMLVCVAAQDNEDWLLFPLDRLFLSVV